MHRSARGFTPYRPVQGFTLIELLVVIAIIAVLSVVGFVVFKGVTAGARDAKRRGDIDVISKAYEVKKSSAYLALIDSDFSSGEIPKDPRGSTVDYFNWLAQDGSGYKVCAALDNNPSNACNTPATNCFCKFSVQETINPSVGAASGSTQSGLGLGGSSSAPSCDTNGTLLSGLVGYWKMDEGAGATTVVDSIGSNNGTYTNGATTADRIPVQTNNLRTGSFDGIDDYVNVPYTPSFALNTISVGAWIKINYPGSGNLQIISRDAGDRVWQFRIEPRSPSGGRIRLIVFDTSSSNYQCFGATNAGDNTWHHVMGTWDGSTMKVYVDGALDNTSCSTTTGTLKQGTTTSIQIATTLGGYFVGLIDDVRVYNRALSPPEIQALWNNNNGCIY